MMQMSFDYIERWLKRFEEAPLLVFWESTKACPLACRHCRAEAIKKPLPGEISSEEGKQLIRQVGEFGEPTPTLIITGGDPLTRKDLFELVEYARDEGVPVGVAPAVSPNLTYEKLRMLRNLGVKAISISLDGATAEVHEGMRQVEGNFNETLRAIALAVNAGFMVQVNTVVWRQNAEQLPYIAELLNRMGVKIWEVFFLIVTGRAVAELDITPSEYEEVLHFLVEVSRYGIQVRTVEAPFFRRVKLERYNGVKFAGHLYKNLVSELRLLLGEPRSDIDPRFIPTRDGLGIIFVAHDGTVYPSGFMPYPLGNIRRRSLVEIYRTHPLLIKMRRAEFKGRCGKCEYRRVCGGSRARAFSRYGDPLESDPACMYTPKGGNVI
jgi:radical SAM protein